MIQQKQWARFLNESSSCYFDKMTVSNDSCLDHHNNHYYSWWIGMGTNYDNKKINPSSQFNHQFHSPPTLLKNKHLQSKFNITKQLYQSNSI